MISGGDSAGSDVVDSPVVVVDLVPMVSHYPHMREGRAGDQGIFVNDVGRLIKNLVRMAGVPLSGLMAFVSFPALVRRAGTAKSRILLIQPV